MRLIDRVEVAYFRSLHSADISDVGDLNILFGRNDSGKSNVLRALNVFFNGETDVDVEPDFRIDLSDIRRAQAQRGASKQFFSVRVHFRVPSNYRRSLGRTVWVKRQWNRDGEVTETYTKGLTTGSRIQLSKFLSSIDFTYIRAIKDAETFSGIVQRMYDAAAGSRSLESSTNTFIDSIRLATDDLSQSLELMFGTPTKLAAPNDMGQLFRSLDFTHGDDEHSLLLQKGDGVKARHIPELLRYINDNEKSVKFFLWGFEEPENSLDLGAAAAEAQRFAVFAQRSDTQVFVTSHSPAFYLSGEGVPSLAARRYFVSKQAEDEVGKAFPPNAIRPIDTLETAEVAMGGASLHELPYMIRKLAELQSEKSELSAQMEAIRDQLDDIRRPSLFVEGESEVRCLLPRLRLEIPNANVRKLKGTPNTTSALLKKLFQDGGALPSDKSVFLFDFDEAGRSAFTNLSGNSAFAEPCMIGDQIAVFCLSPDEPFLDFLLRYSIPEDRSFFPLEFLFDATVAAPVLYDLMSPDQREQAATRIREEYHTCLNQERSHALRMVDAGSPDWLWSRGVPNALKMSYFDRCEAAAVPSGMDDVVAQIAEHLRA